MIKIRGIAFSPLIMGLLIFFSLTTQSSGLELAVKSDQFEEVIIYALPYDFNEYSAFTANSYATAQWVGAVYAGLVKRSSANNRGWVADLAAAMPSISPDGLTFTFTLKSDLYASNGEPITSEDIEFSLHAALTSQINLAGYSAYVNFLDKNSITIESSTTFSITLLQPFAFPYGLLSFPVVPKETFNNRYQNCISGVAADCSWNAEDGSDAIGAGPFMVVDIDNTNEVVTIDSNPFYYNAGNVKTDKIIFQKIAEKNAAISALADGSIHILDSQYVPGLTELDGISGITEAYVGDPATQEISINHKHPYFGTGELIPNSGGQTQAVMDENARQLRRAMSHIVDRNTYVNEMMDGLAQPAATNMPSASLGWDPTIVPDAYDVDAAKAIMTSLGFDYGTLGAPNANGQYESFFFSITVLSPNTNPARNEWSVDYVQQLPKIGIGVTQHVSTGWAEIIPRTYGSSVDPPLYSDGGYDIFFVGYSWALDWNPSGLYDATGSCTTGSCGNFYNFDLDETMTPMAAAVQDYLTELDFDARLQKVSYIQELIYYWLPVIAILYPQSHWAWSADVTGIDSLLISVSSQEWENVYRTGFNTNPGDNWTPPPPPSSSEEPEPESSGGTPSVTIPLPYNTISSIIAIVTFGILYSRKRAII